MMEDSEGSAQANFYYKFWEIPRQTSIPKIADYSAIVLFGVQRSRDFLLNGKVFWADTIDESGGNADLRNETRQFDVMNGQIAVSRHDSGANAKYITQNSKFLDELFSALKERNIQFVIINSAGSFILIMTI